MVTQSEIIFEYYKKYPKRPIEHPEIVDWVVKEFKKRENKVLRDPDRAIRKLSQEGKLVKLGKGVYMYDPDLIENPDLDNFTPKQVEAIFKRDNYRCVFCGRGRAEGVEIQADHIKPRDLGGKSTVENGQTLCAQHNFQKKNYNQTEAGKRFIIRLYKNAVKIDDTKIINFCESIFDVYNHYGINGHISRPDKQKRLKTD